MISFLSCDRFFYLELRVGRHPVVVYMVVGAGAVGAGGRTAECRGCRFGAGCLG